MIVYLLMYASYPASTSIGQPSEFSIQLWTGQSFPVHSNSYWSFSCMLSVLDTVCSLAFRFFVSLHDAKIELISWHNLMSSSICVLYTSNVLLLISSSAKIRFFLSHSRLLMIVFNNNYHSFYPNSIPIYLLTLFLSTMIMIWWPWSRPDQLIMKRSLTCTLFNIFN